MKDLVVSCTQKLESFNLHNLRIFYKFFKSCTELEIEKII
jgi:hypothetical protein